LKEQILRLEPDDDVASAREKLGWVQATHVLVVFPDDPRQRILQRKLDLILLQREATRNQAQLALITKDPIVLESARDLGIATFPNVQASRRKTWETARAQISVSRGDQPVILDADLAEAGSRLRNQSGGTVRQIPRSIRLIFVILLLIALITSAVLLIPTATVRLQPAANQVAVTTTIIADPNPGIAEIDLGLGIIGARVVGVEVESSTTIETTGTIEQPSTKARGAALFTNRIPDQVTIPAGTIVRTSAAQPVRFITLSDATLPGRVGAFVEVPIEAINAGYEGNLPIGRINQIEGPLSSGLVVSNSQPTRGGDVQSVPAISADDLSRLRARLLQELQQRAYAEMQTDSFIALTDTEFIPLESLSPVVTDSEIYSGYAGQPASTVSLDMRVTVQGIAIDELRARQIVYARLAQKIGTGFELSRDSLVIRRGEITGIDDQRRITFIMQGAGDVSAAIDDERVVELVRGKPVDQALLSLQRELPLADAPTIEIWPNFWPFIPYVPFRITIDLNG
jgi:hypothetical protein